MSGNKQAEEEEEESNNNNNSSLTTSFIFFGIVTLAVYYVILKPLLATTTRRRRPADNNNNDINTTTSGATTTTTTIASTTTATITTPTTTTTIASSSQEEEEENDITIPLRKPPHAVSKTAQIVDGLVSFRHSLASKADTNAADTRKERAKVLSRLLALGAGTPTTLPSRGKVVVVSIPQEDLECHQLHRILYLLGTYFTLLVVIHVDDDNNKTNIVDTLVSKLRSEELPSSVLPDHRIVVVQSRIGKIAVVRQLGQTNVQFVVEYDHQIKLELERFGFQVFVYYGDDNTNNKQATNDNAGVVARLSRQLKITE